MLSETFLRLKQGYKKFCESFVIPGYIQSQKNALDETLLIRKFYKFTKIMSEEKYPEEYRDFPKILKICHWELLWLKNGL